MQSAERIIKVASLIKYRSVSSVKLLVVEVEIVAIISLKILTY